MKLSCLLEAFSKPRDQHVLLAMMIVGNDNYLQNWELGLTHITMTDAAQYLCQASTHPPQTIISTITVVGKTSLLNWIFSLFIHQVSMISLDLENQFSSKLLPFFFIKFSPFRRIF